MDGTVVSRNVDVGQTVAASLQAPTIFLVAQDLTKMQVATFTVDAFPGQVFRGRVSQIREAPINVQNVITYDVVIAVSNPDLKLFPGMTANVKILIDRHNNVLRVPNAALRFKPTDAGPGRPAGRRGTAADPPLWVLDTNDKPRAVAALSKKGANAATSWPSWARQAPASRRS